MLGNLCNTFKIKISIAEFFMNMNYIIISFSQYFVNCKIITQKVYMFGDLINCGAHFFF